MASTASTTGTIHALDAELDLSVQGLATVGVTIAVNGPWNGTLIFEGTMARGGTPVWFAMPAAEVTSGASSTTTTVAGDFRLDVSACSQFRVRASIYVDGIATLTIQGSEAASSSDNITTISNTYGLYTLAQQAAFAATMAWWLDPTGSVTGTGTSVGDPIPPSEYTKRTTGLTISGAGLCTVTITNPVATEVLHFPIGIPAGVQLLLIGAGAVTVHAGSVTTYTEHTTVAGGTAVTIADAALPAANSWSTYVRMRGRITAGARAGVCFWVGKDSDTDAAPIPKTCRIAPTYQIPVVFPFDDEPVLTPLVAGDPYVIESLPIVGGLDFSGFQDDDLFDDAQFDPPTKRVLIQDLAFAQDASAPFPNSITRWKGGAGIAFINSSTGSMSPRGNVAWFLGCSSFDVEISDSGSLFAVGTLFGGTTAPGFEGELLLQHQSCYLSLSNCLLERLHSFHISAGLVEIFGDTGVFDCAANGGITLNLGAIAIQYAGAITYGTGSVGRGVDPKGGSSFLYEGAKPTITGAGGDVQIDSIGGGGILSWAQIPYRSLQTGSNVSEFASAAGAAGQTFLGNTAMSPQIPTAGGVIYEVGGALVHRGSTGTITTIAPA